MSSLRTLAINLTVVLIAGQVIAPGSTTCCIAAEAASTGGDFQRDIRPLLESACFKCHGAAKKKGSIDFSIINDDRAARKHMKTWKRAIEQLSAKQMPPDDE